MRFTLFAFLLGLAELGLAHAADDNDLPAKLKKLDPVVIPAADAKAKKLPQMLARDIRSRIHAAHQRQAKAWEALGTKEDWERFRDARIQSLRESFGPMPARPNPVKPRVARTIAGDGYRIDNLVFESRPGLVVTANLYRPAQPPASMPGLLLIHGFHQPKSQGELQDMGVNWAKLGCVVLVPDQLCHGERRQHPFRDAKSYAGKFNRPRQDYYSRANTGVQLDLIGESLMGWMVWDAMRCVDVLLAHPGVDKDRIIVLGAVAAGGDTAAVTAALDPRVSAVAAFNFGGPEPETAYPLPKEPEKAFPYASGGTWDSTRRLRNSARDGFLPWVVVGSVAPRRLIYGHEFAWDREHDPIWPRLQKIYAWYNAGNHLAFVHGSGTLFGKPEGTGCANIGPVHRKPMYPILKIWFGMKAPAKEVENRRPDQDLLCLTPDIAAAVKPRSVQHLARELAAQPLAEARKRLEKLKPEERRQTLCRDLARCLGGVEIRAEPKAAAAKKERVGDATVERIVLEVEPGIVVPLLLLTPARKADARFPVVVGVSQKGKQMFLRRRAAEIADLLRSGVAVCLPDVRGTGETRAAGDGRGAPAGRLVAVQENSAGTLLANEERMLGRTLLGDRLRDLRSVLAYLGGRNDLDAARVGLWGTSAAEANAPGQMLQVPWDAEKLPHRAEPLGGLLALLGALFENNVRAVIVEGGLASYQSILESQFCYVPYDATVPGMLTAGDLCDVTAILAPRGVWLSGMVDGLNRRVPAAALAEMYQPASVAYQGRKEKLVLEPKGKAASWMTALLKKNRAG